MRSLSCRAPLRAIGLVVTFAACGGRARAPVAPPPAAPTLDEVAPWIDPTAFQPVGQPPPIRPLTDAVRNPRARPIAIRGATILTAAGQRPGDLGIERRVAVLGADAGGHRGRGLVAVAVGTGIRSRVHAQVRVGVDEAGRDHLAGAVDDRGPGRDRQIAGADRGDGAAVEHDGAALEALAGGVTTALILPGSANLIGGRGFTVQLRPAL